MTVLARGMAVRLGILLAAMALVTVLPSCGTAREQSAARSGVARSMSAPVKDRIRVIRPPVPPTQAQRRQIVAGIDSQMLGTQGFLSEIGDLAHLFPRNARRHINYAALHVKVTSIRVVASTPPLASAVVEPVDRHGRQVLPTAIIVLEDNSHAADPSLEGWQLAAGPATSFPDSCTPAVQTSLRELLCPNPWTVLGQKPPGTESGLGFTTPAGTTSIRSVNWADVTIPGAACGSDSPIRLHDGAAVIESAVEPWWPAVQVESRPAPVYGELAGQDVAALGIECNNGGGTAEGQLGFAAVVYALRGGMLKVIGLLTPRQPLSLATPHVAIMGDVTITRNNEVITSEGWYVPSGSVLAATTIWKLSAGVLTPVRTVVEAA